MSRRTRRRHWERHTQSDQVPDVTKQPWVQQLEEQAEKEDWPESEKLRRKVIARLEHTLTSPTASEREVVAAARVLIAAGRLNLAAQESGTRNSDVSSLRDYLARRDAHTADANPGHR